MDLGGRDVVDMRELLFGRRDFPFFSSGRGQIYLKSCLSLLNACCSSMSSIVKSAIELSRALACFVYLCLRGRLFFCCVFLQPPRVAFPWRNDEKKSSFVFNLTPPGGVQIDGKDRIPRGKGFKIGSGLSKGNSGYVRHFSCCHPPTASFFGMYDSKKYSSVLFFFFLHLFFLVPVVLSVFFRYCFFFRDTKPDA